MGAGIQAIERYNGADIRDTKADNKTVCEREEVIDVLYKTMGHFFPSFLKLA